MLSRCVPSWYLGKWCMSRRPGPVHWSIDMRVGCGVRHRLIVLSRIRISPRAISQPAARRRCRRRDHRDAVCSQVLKMIADNRLDAFVHATFGNAPARLLRAARGNNPLLALVLGFPGLAMPAVSQATAFRSDWNFLVCRSPKARCSRQRMTSNGSAKIRRPRETAWCQVGAGSGRAL